MRFIILVNLYCHLNKFRATKFFVPVVDHLFIQLSAALQEFVDCFVEQVTVPAHVVLESALPVLGRRSSKTSLLPVRVSLTVPYLWQLIYFRLEVFNGIIQNRLNDNPNVIYAVIRSHKAFEDLGTFTLASGLREVKRIQLTREEQARLDSKKGRIVDLEKGRTTSNEYSETSATPEARHSGEGSLRGSDSEIIASTQPLMSPSGEDFPAISSISEENASQPSEKARGKMPARTSSLSEDMMNELERLASSGVGRKGFVPTQEWVRAACVRF